ncbi:lysoplasmalogenase [Dyella soli]|uniref:Lysoplasmalogenase n=1 Tax=Dyella soli TaxID=522319 RepID=A0A4R0YEH9_9GAMM|nr:lysoplasmalogenase [Dyella soli]TCI06437.1 lysoplasmalogenase [Dyella soli]
MSVSNARAAVLPSWNHNGAVALAAIGAIVGALLAAPGMADGWQWLHWTCKPLATVLILLMAWRTAVPLSARYRRWITIGMLFSLAGDVFLMLPRDAFVPGLVAFLLAHACFIRALLDDVRFAPRPLALLACLAYGALNLWALWPSLPPPLHTPVVVYVAVLAAMAGQALSRAWWHAAGDLAEPSRWAAIGASIFMFSDTLIAWNRFRVTIPLAAMWILATYYVALWCLARSVRRLEKHA